MENRCTYQELKIFSREVFRETGFSKKNAEFIAKTLVDSDFEGHPSHGTFNKLVSYHNRIRKSLIDIKKNGKIIKSIGAIAVIDGQNGMGQIVSRFSTKTAIKLAKKYGIGLVVTKNSNHYGRACSWVEEILKENMIGISTTNSGPHMVPERSKKKFVGTNPIAIGFPAKKNKNMMRL